MPTWSFIPTRWAASSPTWSADPGLTALFGSYDDQPTAAGLPSQYRNLLHHFVHQRGVFEDDVRPVHTFWTGCGAIRRQAFLELGGFDPALYRRPAIEDIEFGYRLARAGFRTALARDVLVTHRKRWTVSSILRTDIFHRGVPWMLLMLRSSERESDLNVSPGQRWSVAATGLGLLGLAAAPWFGGWAGLVCAGHLLALAVLNREFYLFLARRRGWRFAIGAFPLHYLYFVCCGVSVVIALAWRQVQKWPRWRRLEWPRWLRWHEASATPAVPGPHALAAEAEAEARTRASRPS